MIKNGTAPLKLLAALRRAGKVLVTRDDLAEFAALTTHPDRAMTRLVAEGLVEKLDRGVWLVPSGIRPQFEIPRFWSKPSLMDSDRISALVLANPRLRDIVKAMLAYGSRTLDAALDRLAAEGELPVSVLDTSRRMIDSAREGIRNAAHRRPAR